MLSVQDNETLTRVGPGTAMGELMRRYWQPVLLSWELPEPDCPPVRVRVLGEDLVAFRDTSRRVGLLQEWCAHRRTSLRLGRNEEHGLRCVFHGWKYDITGQCVEMPNMLSEYDFKHEVKITAYPTHETGGVIWAYLEPQEQQPPIPAFEWTRQPATHRHVSKGLQESNWLQAPVQYRSAHSGSTVAQLQLKQSATELPEAIEALLASLSDGWIWQVS